MNRKISLNCESFIDVRRNISSVHTVSRFICLRVTAIIAVERLSGSALMSYDS